eukprot:6201586-Pleurochrysis_carterae.AAC.5
MPVRGDAAFHTQPFARMKACLAHARMPASLTRACLPHSCIPVSFAPEPAHPFAACLQRSHASANALRGA